MNDIKDYAIIDIPATLGITDINPTVLIFHALGRTMDKLICKKCKESGKSAVCVHHKAKLCCLYYKEGKPND